eukprot:2526549-Rhodomonas_salina.2
MACENFTMPSRKAGSVRTVENSSKPRACDSTISAARRSAEGTPMRVTSRRRVTPGSSTPFVSVADRLGRWRT